MIDKSKVAALVSVPRLGFQVNFRCCTRAFLGLGIRFEPFIGGGWEQMLQNGMTLLIGNRYEFLIVTDYDSVFEAADVEALLDLGERHPEAAAIVPVEAKRGSGALLITRKDEKDEYIWRMTDEDWAQELIPIDTGHFGLTLIRVSALTGLSKPWFRTLPNEFGEYDGDDTPADIYFWRHLKANGRRAFLAPTIKIGHIEESIAWLDDDLNVIRQSVSRYFLDGKPEGCR